jgi:hypothetical protein
MYVYACWDLFYISYTPVFPPPFSDFIFPIMLSSLVLPLAAFSWVIRAVIQFQLHRNTHKYKKKIGSCRKALSPIE